MLVSFREWCSQDGLHYRKAIDIWLVYISELLLKAIAILWSSFRRSVSMCSFQMRWLSIYTPKTRSDSTLVSCTSSTERSRDCFAEFAIFVWSRLYCTLSLLDALIFFILWKLLQRIAILARARKNIPTEYRLLLYNASIKPLFTYCCTVWSNCSQTNLDKLFKLQKRCARLILDSPRDAWSYDNFQKLKWLPIDQLFKLNKLGLLKKVIDWKAPEY